MFGFELLIAWRFLKSTRNQTLLILTGIIVGVGVQVFLASLIIGLQANLIGQTVGDAPHVFLTSQENKGGSLYPSTDETQVISRLNYTKKTSSISNWQPIFSRLKKNLEITAVSPQVTGSGFILKGNSSLPVVLKGILLAEADPIYKIRSRIVRGEALMGGNNVLIGQDLAENLRLSPGDIFQLTNSDGKASSLIVGGIFDLGNQSLNSSWIFLDLYRGQSILEKGGNISSIEMQISDVFKSENIATGLEKIFPEQTIETWQEKNLQLVNGLQSQSSSSLVIQVFVLLSVTLGIASVLAVSAFQRSKQIGILKAMGARRNSLSRIFFFQGSLLGLTGSLLGSGVGILLVRAFVYATSLSTGTPLFPVVIQKTTLISTILIATIASTVAGIAPARKAASLSPIEVIRNG